jgi:hypothetical protein
MLVIGGIAGERATIVLMYGARRVTPNSLLVEMIGQSLRDWRFISN